MKREPKLRPSMSWDEISLAVAALDSCVATAVKTRQVTKQVMGMIKVKEYLETFKPVVKETRSEEEQLAFLMRKYGVAPAPAPVVHETAKDPELVNDLVSESLTNLPDAPLDKTPLTDEERYDMLKLMGEDTYTTEDFEFMNSVGFLIMMRRSKLSKIDSSDI